MPASNRLALIAVVAKCVNYPDWDLPVVLSDANQLEHSLARSKYTTRVIGRQSQDECSGTRILTAIRKACEEVQEGGTLLIFFSGHGLHIDGHHYLVPADVDLHLPDPKRALVCVADLSSFVENSKAAQVVLFLDACREGMSLGSKNISLTRWGEEKRALVHKRMYSIVHSCRVGSYSHYVTEGGGFSLFSSALAHALSIDSPARSLGEVIEAAQQRLDELSSQYGKPPQIITFSSESDAKSDSRVGIICESRGRSAGHMPSDSWADAVQYSTLWSMFETNVDVAEELAEFQAATVSIAQQAEACHALAARQLGDDPWRDPGYPIRVIRALEQLTADGCQPALSLPETALLLAAPFVREQVYAAAVLELVAARPHEPDVDAATLPQTAQSTRRRLDTTLRAHPQLLRRWQTIRNNGNSRNTKADCRAIMLWLMHRDLARFAGMWHEPEHGTLPPDAASITPPSAHTEVVQRVAGALSRDRLLKLAKCVRCEVDRISRTDVPQPLVGDVREGPAGEPIRERLLGSMLCLAGWVALDVRAANEVTVDHVGIHDPIEPASLVGTASRARWLPVGTGLQLGVDCEHPAIDFTLRDLVAQANRALIGIVKVLGDYGETSDAAVLMPGQLIPDGVVAATENGRPRYTLPHQRFTLAHDEVRELLMGEQLYGDPDLALRELYQNALDACRYRKARTEYLARVGKRIDWQGKIVFRQGSDKGRPYIECEDNGIGMGQHELESCFARAGRRFADLPEFIEEQELWLQCEPPVEMTPNSQFGIGVLSYFMIADEIAVSTCRLDREGRPQKRLEVRIPGSGSLFRIQPGNDKSDAGTVIRLYLREDWTKSCVEVLSEILVLAEFETHAVCGFDKTSWQAGQPQVEGGCVPTSHPDFWWVNRRTDCAVLSDGLVVEIARGALSQWDTVYTGRGAQGIFGAIINFRGRNKARLTVDRNKVLECNSSWVERCFESEAGHLAGAPWLRFGWLWQLAPPAAEAVEPTLAEQGCELPLGYLDEILNDHDDASINLSVTRTWLEPELWLSSGFPVAVLGINDADALALQWLWRLTNRWRGNEDDTCGASLRFLLRSWRHRRLPTRRKPPRHILKRAALLVQLGVPAPERVVAKLPKVEKRNLVLKPKKLPPAQRLKPRRLRSIGKKLSTLVRRYGLALPLLLAILVMMTIFGLSTYVLIGLVM